LAVRRDALPSEHTDLVRVVAYQLFRRQNHSYVVDLIQGAAIAPDAAISGQELDTAEVFEAYASVRTR
jgi:hypothetical protein